MESVLKFDRVVLVKELDEKIKKVGEVFEVASIMENSFLLRDAKTRVAIGVVSFEDFEKHFVKEEGFKGWTHWTPLTGFDGQTDVLYRTNRKKIQMKFITDKVRAESCCHKMDEFNLYFGVKMTYLRCLNQALKKRKAEHEAALKKINCEIADNDIIIRNMIASLDLKD